MDGDQGLWARNASILKRLYQDEGKPLKEVKSIMEEQHGFPRIPISAYQTNLRHRQGLQKRLKAKDWPRIYHYAQANGFEKFDVVLNDTVIPWIRAWKEIRRSGVTRFSLPVDHLATLPDKVELRRLEEPVHRSRLRDRTVHVLAPRIDASPLLSPQNDEVQIYTRRVNSPNSPSCPSSMPSGLESISLPHTLSQDIPISSDGLNYTISSTNITTSGSSQEVPQTQSVMLRHQATIDKLSIDQLRHIFARVNLETIPWNQYRLSLYAMRNGGDSVPIEYQQRNGQYFALMPADGFFGHVPKGLQVLLSETRYPMTFDLADTVLTPKTLAARFDPYHFLAQVVYIVSNYKILELGNDFTRILNTLANEIPRQLVFSIFKSNSLSIRAVWEKLFKKAFSSFHSTGMDLFIDIALRFHSEWIEQEKNEILYAAVLTGNTSLVRALLDRGASTAYYKFGTMFALAAYKKAKNCAKLLIENCRPNDLIIDGNPRFIDGNPPKISPDTVFSRFLSDIVSEYAGKDDDSHNDYSSDRLDILKMVLEGMLQSGADVDALFPLTGAYWDDYYLDCNVPQSLKPTCSDVCFYMHTEIFNQALPYSRRHIVRLTRDGVCTAALQSKEALSTYLDSFSTTSNVDIEDYLRATLIDQFSYFQPSASRHMPRLHGVGGRIAQALIKYGVRLTPKPGLGVLEEFLHRVVKSAAQYGLNDSLAFLTEHLIEQGAVVDSTIVAECLRQGHATVFNLLIQSGAEVAQFGQRALEVVANDGNYEAVCLLLTAGVDINAVVNYGGPEDSMTILASLLIYPRGKSVEVETRRSMWQFLIHNGARLRLCPQDTTSYRLLKKIVQFSLLCKWSALDFMLQFEEEVNQIAPSQWMDLLVLSLKTAAAQSFEVSSAAYKITGIADVLLQRCGGRVSQPVLAVAIAAGCEPRLINDLIESGQSIHEPSGGMTPLQAAAKELNYELVSTLLQHGVDINAPACNDYGADALQFACQSRYASNLRVEHMRLQSRLVKLLLAKGADVNGPVNGIVSRTALQLICGRKCRNREEADHHRNLVTFLLESGADANAAPGNRKRTALQLCAEEGDLETTSLLIQYGADPNGHPRPANPPDSAPCSALDFSAENGRLDMTQYLLNVGALSARPGASGFQGAMDGARANGHHAVREIILKHVKKVSQQHIENPIMQQAHEESIQRHAAALKERQEWYDSMK